MALTDYLSLTARGETLTAQQARSAFSTIMEGRADPLQIAGFLTSLSARGETVHEIAGAASVMREKAASLTAPQGAIDTCGTGGDGHGTYNISTAVAFVVAGAGVPVAKHGNRAASSKSGAADVLAALGFDLDHAGPAQAQRSLEEAGICFLMAPAHHAAMRHVVPVRQALKVRTIFNLLGPLANPAGTKRQLIGVFDKSFLRPMAEALRELGAEAATVVHGADGLDEVTTTAETHIAQLSEDGSITESILTPEDAGLPRASLTDLQGGTPQENANALSALLDGTPGSYRDIVLFNSAVALQVAGKAYDLTEAMQLAKNSIDNGAAKDKLETLVRLSKDHDSVVII
ncbi:MAG: anthranilate phosphoribosyltransferase [Alphaproteobacteria bacterium]